MVGIADCHYKPANTDELLKVIAAKIDVNSLSFKQQVDVLHALSVCSSSVAGALKVPLFGKLMKKIDLLNFERVDHELTHGQYE